MTNEQIKQLEEQLWGAADSLRANSKLTAAEYKDPVLGLILLRFAQNRFEEAQTKLDSITTIYPEHSLEDDVFYSKAQIHMKKREYQDAIGFYEKIIEKYPEEIRADNALFEMAQLFELILEDKVKALELYEKLFLQYSGSTFSVEARKRFRILRGDEI